MVVWLQIALWGGNNEVEAALQWFPESQRLGPEGRPELYAVDYSALFVDAARQVPRFWWGG